MTEQLTQNDATPTRIEWKFDDSTGALFQRFSRKRDIEVHLIGRETPVNDEHRDRLAGAKILDRGAWRETKFFAWCLSFSPDPAIRTEVAGLAEEMKGMDASSELWWACFNRLLLLSTPGDPYQTRVSADDVERIAEAVWQRFDVLPPNRTAG